MNIKIKPKRCTECKKLLCQKNKSGLCSYHYMLHGQRKRRAKKND